MDEVAQLKIEITGWEKANALLLAGMERLSEINDKLKQEVRRLKNGEFTEEEFQNLCHNMTTDDLCRFATGCKEYQKKLFGRSLS